MQASTELEVRDFLHRWDAAMLTNDPVRIGSFMADEWTIVGSDGSVEGKERFLSLVASGELGHDEMTTQELRLRIYGDTAVAISRGTSGGQFRGTPFFLVERSSCVLVRRAGQWTCVLTHLSLLSAPAD